MVGALLLSAGASAQEASWRYACPAAGTVVERSRGEPIVFRASDPNDPFVCMTGGGRRVVLGIWTPNEALYVNGRQQLASLLTGMPGDVRRFYYLGTGADQSSIEIDETWRHGGFERATVPAGTYESVRLERNFRVRNTAYTYTQTLWLDRATNVPVKVEVTHLNALMAPTLFSWVATDIRPGTAARAGS